MGALIISMMLFKDPLQQTDAREQLEKQHGLKSRGVVVSFQFFTLVGDAKPTESLMLHQRATGRQSSYSWKVKRLKF